jgi:tetratricopeptide (TPR) repeat protein
MTDASQNPTPESTPPQPEDAPQFMVTLPDEPGSLRDWGLWAGVLALLTLICFWPAISGGFLWDDDHYVTRNQTLTNHFGLIHIWAPTLPKMETVQYYPLTFTALWIEHHLWQDSPLGYRVVNLILHAAAAIVVWRILRRLRLPGAWVIAAIWAVHPLQAESVCWISECKNVLSGLLAFTSLLFYLDFVGLRDPDSPHTVWKLPHRWQTYAFGLIFFIAAMLSKSVVCALPAALVLILWWQRRLTRETFFGLIPMFIIGAVGGFWTSHLETDPAGYVQATGGLWDIPLLQRFLIAGQNFWFYIGKIFAPFQLSFNYPRKLPVTSDARSWVYLIGAIVVIDLLLMFRRFWGRGPATAVLCYVAAIFPALGFFNIFPFRFSFVADHFQYLAGLPLIALAVVIIAQILQIKTNALAVLTSIAILGLSTLAWNRSYAFVDTATLWQDTLQKNPDSWLAAFNLSKDRAAEATDDLDEANALQEGNAPDQASAVADEAAGKLDDAEALLWKVINNSQKPRQFNYLSYNQLAEIKSLRTRWPKADAVALVAESEGFLQTAIAGEQEFDATNPDARPYYNMGRIKMTQAEMLRRAGKSSAPTTTTRPATPEEQQVIDLVVQAQDYFQQAVERAQRMTQSIASRPDAVLLWELSSFQRGNADFTLGGLAQERHDIAASDEYSRQAIGDYSQSLALNVANVEANFRIALCLERLHYLNDAIRHLKLCLIYTPSGRNAPALNEIGWIFCVNNPTMERLQIAIQCFKDAISIDPKFTEAQGNLDKAMIMLKSARPVTQPSTQAARSPATNRAP